MTIWADLPFWTSAVYLVLDVFIMVSRLEFGVKIVVQCKDCSLVFKIGVWCQDCSFKRGVRCSRLESGVKTVVQCSRLDSGV